MAELKLTGSGAITGGATLGCDPEFFYSRRGVKNRHIVGSERVLGDPKIFSKTAPVSPDGVQAEIHPTSSYCRQGHASYIMSCMKEAAAFMAKAEGRGNLKGLQVDFRTTVQVSRAELARLSEGSRILGCMPSENAYGHKKIEPDGKIVTTRSAGGHIHFGSKYDNPADFAKICDVLIGIPAVLIDRDPHAAKRRKLYGRAGEYRTPKHGFEYRTLSNFWLRDYVVYALIFGLAKNASGVHYTSLQKTNGYNHKLMSDILGCTDWDKVRTAINKNDFDLAYEVFNEISRPVFQSFQNSVGLNMYNIHLWDHFVEKGLDHWFPFDNAKILARWTSPLGYGAGWESWADSTLRGSYEKESRSKGQIKIDPITGKAL